MAKMPSQPQNCLQYMCRITSAHSRRNLLPVAEYWITIAIANVMARIHSSSFEVRKQRKDESLRTEQTVSALHQRFISLVTLSQQRRKNIQFSKIWNEGIAVSYKVREDTPQKLERPFSTAFGQEILFCKVGRKN